MTLQRELMPALVDSRRALRVLVVDDEPPIVALARGYFEREGWDVETASDGLEAIESVRSADPDFVVLDIGLPGIDGLEVCRRLRTFSDAFVVLLTARSAEADKLDGLAVGADDYLTKPFSPRELVARIKAISRRSRISPAAQVAFDADVATRAARVPSVAVAPTDSELDVSPRTTTRQD